MAVTERQRKCIDIVQWVLIFILIGICAVICAKNHRKQPQTEKGNDSVYTVIYESQKIEELKKKNKALYDSLVVERNKKPESAIEIRYKYKYKTDTVTVDKFALNEDSVYEYSSDNDTIKTEIALNAKDLKWVSVNATINDKFTIINRTDGNSNETTIGHSGNVEIVGADVWHKKKTFKDRLSIGPQVGVGWGFINNKPDIYVGIGGTIKLGKLK